YPGHLRSNSAGQKKSAGHHGFFHPGPAAPNSDAQSRAMPDRRFHSIDDLSIYRQMLAAKYRNSAALPAKQVSQSLVEAESLYQRALRFETTINDVAKRSYHLAATEILLKQPRKLNGLKLGIVEPYAPVSVNVVGDFSNRFKICTLNFAWT